MIVYTAEAGYGNQDVKEVREVIDKYLPVGSRDKVVLLEFLHDYEVLKDIVQGDKNCIYRHADRSETRRVKLYV